MKKMRPEEVGGGARPDLIAATVIEDSSGLPETPAQLPTVGVPELIDALRTWLRNDDLAAAGTPVAFVSTDSIRRFEGEAIPLLTLPNDRTLVGGSVYVCSQGLGQAIRFDAGASIETLIDTVRTLELTERGIVIYMPHDQKFAWLPNGVDDLDTRFEERLELGAGQTVTRVSVGQLLDRIYALNWITPTAGGRIWEDPGRRVPVKAAESVFQGHVQLGCKLTFAAHRTATEFTGASGRCDVLMFPKMDPPEPQGRAVIEMKVLRAFHYAPRGRTPNGVGESENKRAVRKGVGQAMRYGTENGCTVRILCLCDMRERDDAAMLRSYEAFGERHGVSTHRYFMYASVDEYGEAELRRAEAPDA